MTDRTAAQGGEALRRSLVRKKVCMVGDFGVGKTSLVEQFVYGVFKPIYHATIGVSIQGKVVTVPSGGRPVEVQMQLWDIAGSRHLSENPLRENYLRGSHGALLVCDLTRRDTLANLERYAEELARARIDVAIVLAANKSDLAPEEKRVTEAEVAAMASQIDATSWYLTSAKSGDNVEVAFAKLAEMMVGHA